MAHASSPLLLLPLNPEAGLDVLSIDSLPCIIGRAEGVFSQHAQKFPDALRKISRRHARLFVEDSAYFIQDLGSTNGTLLAGNDIGVDAKPLKDGDTLAFSDLFSYSVQLPQPARKRSLADALAAIKASHGAGKTSPTDATSPPPVHPPPPDKHAAPVRPQKTARDNDDPSEFNRLVDAGQNRFREGDFEAAFDAYQKALELRSDALDVKERLRDTQTELKFATLIKSADGLLDAGRIDEGKAALEEAGRVKPEDEALDRCLRKTLELEARAARVEALCAEGEGHAEQGAFETAIERYREALALEPRSGELQARIDDLEASRQALEAQQVSVEAGDQTRGDQTILIDDATNFLKAISHSREEEASPREGERGTDAKAEIPADAPGDNLKKPSVLRAVLATFFSRPEASPRRKWMAGSLSLLAILVIIVALVVGQSPGRKLKRLVSAGEYASALRYAARELAKDPGDENLNRLATRALMGVVINPWMEATAAGRFSDAEAILDEAAPSTDYHPEGRILLGLLNWILGVERFSRQQAAGVKLVLFRDEGRVTEMLQGWEVNESRYRAFLDRIPASYPPFEGVRKQTYSRLSHLKAMAATEIKAIQALVAELGTALDQAQSQTLGKRLDDFERRFPGVGGTKRLRDDLTHYNRLWHAIASKQVGEIAHLLETYRFSTPAFARKVEALRDTALPSAQILAAHARADRAWRAGEGEAAIGMLAPLTAMPWGAVAEKGISRYRGILKQLAELEAKRNQPDYGLMVLKLYGQLQPGGDDYYIDSLEKKARQVREKELTRAGRLFAGADTLWRDYLESDGITGYLRLESRVSTVYRRQAERLKAATEKVGMANTIYRLLKVDLPKRWAVLSDKVGAEVEIQKIRLDGLKGVLPPEVFAKKMTLLPEM